ncbi:MAG: hypothetical protein JNM07_13125 [Phycisphaerae bacterium]|nr:hypothetical protein [Phycisphaerae bacterium]
MSDTGAAVRPIPGVEVWRLSGPPRVEWVEGAAPAAHPDAERVWRDAVAANPRLHDAPIVVVAGADRSGLVRCRAGSYRAFVVSGLLADEGGAGGSTLVEALGVTGCVRRTAAGVRSILLGRRGRGTRIYGGMWETAPRGGVEPPGRGECLGMTLLVEQLRRELREEVGDLPGDMRATPIALVRDHVAHTLDVVFDLDAGDVPAGAAGDTIARRGWEYSDVRWVRDAARGAPGIEGGSLSPPTAALLLARAAWGV